MDKNPRKLTQDQRRVLTHLSRQVTSQLELRLRALTLQEARRQARYPPSFEAPLLLVLARAPLPALLLLSGAGACRRRHACWRVPEAASLAAAARASAYKI